MTKEIKVLAVSFLLVNLIVYFSLAFVNLTFSPMWWGELSRSIFGGVFSVSFIAVLAWVLFKPE